MPHSTLAQPWVLGEAGVRVPTPLDPAVALENTK